MDASASQVHAKGLAVVASICYQLFGLSLGMSRTSLGNPDQTQGLLSQGDFRLLRTVQQDGQRKAVPIRHQHPLGSFAFSGQSYGLAPLLDGAKLPSRKARCHSNLPCSSRVVSKARKMLSHTPCSSHLFNLRQQVEGWLNCRGKSFQRQPLLSTCKMPFNTCRSSALGRPILPWAGIKGRITSHWSSVNSVSMAESTSTTLRPELNPQLRLLQPPLVTLTAGLIS